MPVGIDIVDISRIKNLIGNSSFLNRFFSDAEMDYFNTKKDMSQSVAGNFSAKEAFSKAIGTGIRNFNLKEISVLRDGLGKPYFEFSDSVKCMLNSMGISQIDVSISHEKDYAIAIVNTAIDDKYIEFKHAISKSVGATMSHISYETARDILPKRKPDTHKGDFGKVLIIAGSTGLTGAGILASKAALKTGCGLITLGCPKSLNHIFETTLLEVMTYPLPDFGGVLSVSCAEDILNKCNRSDVLLFGCGLSTHDDIQKILEYLIPKINVPIVIDADGLNALSKNINILKSSAADIVLTPHLMEFSRLSGHTIDEIRQNKEAMALSFAKEYGVTLVLKSENTIIATKDGSLRTNILGNCGMATGGSGDVLAGVITSLIGQNISAIDSAVLGVYLHSLAGDLSALDKGVYGMTPTDIIENIPYAIKYLGGI